MKWKVQLATGQYGGSETLGDYLTLWEACLAAAKHLHNGGRFRERSNLPVPTVVEVGA